MAVSANRVLRIATRKSPLALWQAEHVASLLLQQNIATTLVPLVSTGDVDMRPIDGTRQVGLFTKRIQQALLDDEADIAVHSMKDLPTEKIAALALAAIPAREDVRDCLVSNQSWSIDKLPKNARIGTGSKRRAAQLLNARPDLEVLPIRGNVQTRLQKLSEGEYDAIMLANAGLLRLEMSDLNRSILSVNEMLPAPGQGALGLEVRSDDDEAKQSVAAISDFKALAAVKAERTILSRLNGGCLAPIAAYAFFSDEGFEITARVLSTDGQQSIENRMTASVDPDDEDECKSVASQTSDQVTEDLLNQGAKELIAQSR